MTGGRSKNSLLDATEEMLLATRSVSFLLFRHVSDTLPIAATSQPHSVHFYHKCGDRVAINGDKRPKGNHFSSVASRGSGKLWVNILLTSSQPNSFFSRIAVEIMAACKPVKGWFCFSVKYFRSSQLHQTYATARKKKKTKHPIDLFWIICQLAQFCLFCCLFFKGSPITVIRFGHFFQTDMWRKRSEKHST